MERKKQLWSHQWCTSCKRSNVLKNITLNSHFGLYFQCCFAAVSEFGVAFFFCLQKGFIASFLLHFIQQRYHYLKQLAGAQIWTLVYPDTQTEDWTESSIQEITKLATWEFSRRYVSLSEPEAHWETKIYKHNEWRLVPMPRITLIRQEILDFISLSGIWPFRWNKCGLCVRWQILVVKLILSTCFTAPNRL